MATQFEMSAVEHASVTCTPGIMGGQPCVSGTRVLAETVRQYLIAGDGKREIFSDYPYLPVGAVEAVIVWAKANRLECSNS
jgi:uncharacterized protein (DUF433 family)